MRAIVISLLLFFAGGCGHNIETPHAKIRGTFTTPGHTLLIKYDPRTAMGEFTDTVYVSFSFEFIASVYKGDHAYDSNWDIYLTAPPRFEMDSIWSTGITVAVSQPNLPPIFEEATP